MKAVNRFVRWLKEEGEGIAAEGRKLPKLPKKLVTVLSREDIARLEAVAAAERDRLIVRVLADCGIRVGELVKLTTSAFEERSGSYFLKVSGKGARERLVPLDRPLYRCLRRYPVTDHPKPASRDRVKTSHRAGTTIFFYPSPRLWECGRAEGPSKSCGQAGRIAVGEPESRAKTWAAICPGCPQDGISTAFRSRPRSEAPVSRWPNGCAERLRPTAHGSTGPAGGAGGLACRCWRWCMRYERPTRRTISA